MTLFRAQGLYGHARLNAVRAVVVFALFLVSLELAASALVSLPVLFLDYQHFWLEHPAAFARRYLVPIGLIGTGVFAIQLARHDVLVRPLLPLRPVSRRQAPHLHEVVDEQATLAGLRAVRCAVIDSPARNALAFGLSRHGATVAVTSGALSSCSKTELRAMVAQQVAHIRAGDVQLRAAASVASDLVAALRRLNKLRPRRVRVMLLLLVFAWPILFLTLMLALIEEFADTLARFARLVATSSRGLACDADAIRATHDPAALIGAIRRSERGPALEIDPRLWPFLFHGPAEGAMAAHRPAAERVAAIRRHGGSGAYEAYEPPAAAWPARRRFLFDRVSMGTNEGLFGVQRPVGYVCVALLVFVFTAPQIAMVRQSAREERPLSPEIQEARARSAILDELHRQDPIDARCVRVRPVMVQGEPPAVLDEAHVTAVATGRERYSQVEPRMEAILGLRRRTALRTRNAVEDYGREGADEALTDYVRMRTLLLGHAASNFGEAGIEMLMAAYDTEADATSVEAIAAGLADGAYAPGPEDIGPARLLADAPEDFVPCSLIAFRRLQAASGAPQARAPDPAPDPARGTLPITLPDASPDTGLRG